MDREEDKLQSYRFIISNVFLHMWIYNWELGTQWAVELVIILRVLPKSNMSVSHIHNSIVVIITSENIKSLNSVQTF